MPWEQTDLYKRLKPKYDEAVETVVFLNDLKVGIVGKDIPQHLRLEIIRNLEDKKKDYDQTIERFQSAEQRHRKLTLLSEVIARLHSQEEDKGALVDQPIVYIASITQDNVPELYVPLNDELAATFLGSLLLSQLDKLGERIQPYKTFFRYRIDPHDVLRTQTEYDFYNLGIKVSLFSLMEDASVTQSVIEADKQVPTEQAETPQEFSEGATRLLETIRRLKQEGREARPTILAGEMDLAISSIYHYIHELTDAAKIKKRRVTGNHVEYDLS